MGLVGFIVFVSVEWLYQISDYIIRNRVGIRTLLLFVGYNLPYFTFLGIPVGVLFAIFWVVSELYSNHEITAMLVHGIPSKRLVTPFVILALFSGFFSWLLGDFIVPTANYKSSQILYAYIFQSPEAVVKTNTLVELERDLYFYVKAYDKEKGELYDVVVFKNDEGHESIVTAKKVQKKKDGWYLIDGNMYVVELETGFLRLDMQFKTMKLDVAAEIEEMLRTSKTIRDKTSRELREQLEAYKKLGVNVSHLVVELHQRYANAVGALVIVLIGIPVSLLFGFKSKSWGVITTFVIVVLYQGSGAWLSGLGKEGYMEPMLAVWLPNIIFSVLGLLLYLVIDTPLAFRLRELLARLFTFLLLALLLVPQSQSLASTGMTGTIRINAQVAYISENLVVLSGSVRVTWDKYLLETEVATATLVGGRLKKIEAGGNVSFAFDDQKYVAKYLSYEFEETRAVVLGARTVYNYTYEGRRVPIYVSTSKLEYEADPARTELFESYVTTCNFDEPHYKVLASRVEVVENRYIIAQNAFLFVMDIPIFPYPIYLTALEGKPPYSFSLIFSGGLQISNTFTFKVRDWALELTLSGAGVEFTAVDESTRGRNRITFSSARRNLEITYSPITYRYNPVTGATFFRIDGPLYAEGNYLSDTNFSQRVGVNYSSPDGRFFARPSLTYDGRITDTILILNGGIRNLSFDLPLEHRLTLSSVDVNVRAQTDGYPTNLQRTWSTAVLETYNLSLANKVFGYTTSVQGNLQTDSFNRTVLHTYQLPWSFVSGPLALNLQYSFSLRNTLSQTRNVSREFLGMTDRYLIEGRYSVGPFSLSARWSQVYAFIDEPQASNQNVISGSISVSTPAVSLSTTRGFDLLTGRQAPEAYSIRFSPDLGFAVANGALSFTFDPNTGTLSSRTISAGFSLKWTEPVSYSVSFTIVPGQPVQQFTHSARLSNLSVTVNQFGDYVRSAVGSGFFFIGDYRNSVSLNYSQPTRTATPTLRGTYTIERPGERYSLSYNVTGTEILTFSIDLKNIDPKFTGTLSYDLRNQLFRSLRLNFEKDLHCWQMTTGFEFSFKPNASFLDYLDKFFIKFFLTDLPDKFFSFDSSTRTFQVGGM